MRMNREELEYAISQYIDGTLPRLERAALEERLASDAPAREILAEYRALDTAIKSAMPVPEIPWDAFGARLRDSLAKEEAPARRLSLRSVGWVGRMAIAAVLLFTAGISLHYLNNASTPGGAGGLVKIQGPQAAQATGPVVAEISIGPSASVANNWRAAEEVVSRPTVVLIDRARAAAHDSDGIY